MPGRDVTPLFAYLDSRISDVVACIDRSGPVSLALIVDENRRLLSTVTDGDVRRALLAGCRLTDPVTMLLERKGVNPDHVPVTAPAASGPEALVQLMNERRVRQLPLLDPEGRV